MPMVHPNYSMASMTSVRGFWKFISSPRGAGGGLRWAAAVVLLIVLCGGTYWYAKLRDHATYYRYYAKRWGAFTGIGLIGEDQARVRAVSYRFLTRGRWGPTYRMEAVNGTGYCPMISPMAHYIGGDLTDRDFTSRRHCAWEFDVDANGHARSERGFDFMGRPAYELRYSGADALVADYYNAAGLNRAGSAASRIVFERIETGARAGFDAVMRFRDADGRPRQNHQRVYGVRSEFDEQGRRLRTTYIDRDDRPMADQAGIVTIVAQYNEQGDVASRFYLDQAGLPMRTQAGYSSLRIGYDGVGNDVSYATFDPDGKPFARPQGYAEMRYQYDKRGNIELISYFDAAGRATRIQSRQSKVRRASDSRGWLGEVVYLDENDQPIVANDGSATERLEYDAESNLVRQQYLDAQGTVSWQVVRTFAGGLLVQEIYQDSAGRAAPRPLGHSGMRLAYRGNLISERVYLDAERRPLVTSRKFAKQDFVYDDRGNAIEVAYRDDQNRPVLSDEGYATVKRQFNERGDTEREDFLGLNNEPINNAFGYSQVRMNHDEYGRAIKVRYFAADGRPVWPEKECSFDRTYDTFGRERTTVCMRGDKPAVHADGWTRRAVDYDAVGNAVRERYFDAAGAPVRDRNGVARFERSYDAFGNLADQRFFDERDAAVAGPNGCGRIVQEFNRFNSNIDEKCLTPDGEPAERLDGVSRVVIDRDAQDRVTRSTFHMLRIPDGWPTRVLRQYRDRGGLLRKSEYVDDAGVVRLALDIDEKSRAIGTSYFGVQGLPQRGPAGFAKSRVLTFDEFGGADMEFEDERGKPVEPAILVTSVKEGRTGARAGLRPYDLILRYDGRDIHYGEFAARTRAPGRVVREIVVLRGNALVTLQAEPGALDVESEPVERP